jgi:translocation and assembly module TamA
MVVFCLLYGTGRLNKSAAFRICCILLLLLSFSLRAEDSKIAVTVQGVEKSLAETLLLGLTIERHKDSERLSQRYVEKLH